MPVDAVTPVLAVSVLAWVMIGLPILLAVGGLIAYLMGRTRRTTEEIERAQQASDSGAPGPGGPTGRSPGA